MYDPELDPTLPSTEPLPVETTRSRLKRVVWEWVKTLGLVAFLVLTIRAFVVEAYVIKGSSMEPTFHETERLLVSKFSPGLDQLERGDIIIFTQPTAPGKRLIKRIVGLPGETVEIIRGDVYIQLADALGPPQPLNEPYVTMGNRKASYHPAVTLGPDEYFVLGDHRQVSNDSRKFGPIREQQVVGRAILLFFPQIRFF